MKTLYTKTIKRARVILPLTCFFFIGGHLAAQEIEDLPMSYYQQEMHINPAFVGSQGVLSASVGISKKWMDVHGAPETQRVQINSPLHNDKMGVGLSFVKEKFGITNRYNINAAYAYRINMEKNGILSLGLQAGLSSLQHRYSDAYSGNIPDPEFSENTGDLYGFNFGVGAYYTDPTASKYYIGLSVPRFIDNTIKEGVGYKLNNKIEFDKLPLYLAAGYVFHVSENLDVKPTALLHYSGQKRFRYDFGATAFISQKFWIGAFTRSKSEVGATVGLNLFNYLNVSYAYSSNFGQPYEYRGATHQIVMGFNWSSNQSKLKLRYF